MEIRFVRPEEEAQLQAHLASCPACRAILTAYEEMDRGLASLQAEPPAALISGVMDAIGQEAAPPKKIRRFPTRGIAATAVAAKMAAISMNRFLITSPFVFTGRKDSTSLPHRRRPPGKKRKRGAARAAPLPFIRRQGQRATFSTCRWPPCSIPIIYMPPGKPARDSEVQCAACRTCAPLCAYTVMSAGAVVVTMPSA